MNTGPKGKARAIFACIAGTVLGCSIILIPVIRPVPSPPVIAFIPRTSGTNFTQDMYRGAQAAARSAGYEVYWNAPTREDDVERQILLAEAAVRKGAKALVLGPTNPSGITTMLDEFENRHVPVVIVQTEAPIPTGPFLTSVTPDQSEFGRIAAARVAKVTGGAGEVAIIGLDRGTPETLVRAQSFEQALAAFPQLEVVAQSPGAVQTLEAEQSAREVIGAFPRLKAIFAVSADATQGAMLALQSLDPKHGIALIGCDRDLFLVDNMRSGKIDSIVAADGYRIGFLAVRAALAGAQGHPLQAPEHVGGMLLTPEHSEITGN
jgi:ribose transport system substrate-binding protein